MKQKNAKALLPVAASIASAIIGSRLPSAKGVSVEDALKLLERVMQQLQATGLDGTDRKDPLTDRQLVAAKPAEKESAKKPAKGKQPKHDKVKPIAS